MEKQVNQVRVRIMDEDYTLASEEKDNYMLLLANYVDQKMQGIRQSNPYLSRSRIAVLTALNLADELTKLQEEYDDLLQRMDEKEKEKTAEA